MTDTLTFPLSLTSSAVSEAAHKFSSDKGMTTTELRELIRKAVRPDASPADKEFTRLTWSRLLDWHRAGRHGEPDIPPVDAFPLPTPRAAALLARRLRDILEGPGSTLSDIAGIIETCAEHGGAVSVFATWLYEGDAHRVPADELVALALEEGEALASRTELSA